jgi:hypothetical protein
MRPVWTAGETPGSAASSRRARSPGARDRPSVGFEDGNAFRRGMQAAAPRPADFLDDVLYLMEHAATERPPLGCFGGGPTGGGRFTADDEETGIEHRDTLTTERHIRAHLDTFRQGGNDHDPRPVD